MISLELRARIRRYFYAEHWKIGTIAAELGLHRDTVALAVGTDAFTPRTAIVRPSMLDPHRAFVEQMLAEHPRLLATRLYEMLRARGYRGSVVQLRRLVARTRPRHHEAYLRLDTPPGEQAQADWASFGYLEIGRARRRLSLFVMVLSWCRAIFARFTLDQQMESFLRCHHEAFAAFGGVPRQILYDNLKSVVLERDGDRVRFHPRILALSAHYHFEPRPCAPYRGNEKGKVERAIRYIRGSFFAARRYKDLEDLNRQLALWLDEVTLAREVPSHER